MTSAILRDRVYTTAKDFSAYARVCGLLTCYQPTTTPTRLILKSKHGAHSGVARAIMCPKSPSKNQHTAHSFRSSKSLNIPSILRTPAVIMSEAPIPVQRFEKSGFTFAPNELVKELTGSFDPGPAEVDLPTTERLPSSR